MEPLFPINATKKGRKKNFYHVIQNWAHESTKMSSTSPSHFNICGTHPGLHLEVSWPVKWLWWSDCSQKVWSDDLTSFALSIKNEKAMPKSHWGFGSCGCQSQKYTLPRSREKLRRKHLRKKISQLICRIFPQMNVVNPAVGACFLARLHSNLSGSRGVHSAVFTTVARSSWGLYGLKNITWNLKLYIQKC